ncbi:hypothetical protein MTR67_040120 [Solanum verrucosum]|uniref:Uncharacterized protein n=1 Tax=Solanum verrucosum TaxID=315347 RepID=A0AAF0UI23_SOLVR|nr:hypothetical protein MTR67_040120 [Solanum verrucosum]
MSEEYALKITQLVKYTLTMVADSRVDMVVLNYGKGFLVKVLLMLWLLKVNKYRVSNHNTHGGTGNGSSNPACQRNCKKAQPSGSGSGAPRQNKFYALQTRQDHEGSQNVVTSMLKVFHFDVYDLLDLGATFPFVTPYVAMRFDVGHVILSNPFYVPTPIDDSIIA